MGRIILLIKRLSDSLRGIAMPRKVSSSAGYYDDIRMNKISNTRLFFACALFWVCFFANYIGIGFGSS